MSETPTVRRSSFILTLWAEGGRNHSPTWRGYLETSGGQRRYFNTLTDLNRLLRELSGWSEREERLS